MGETGETSPPENGCGLADRKEEDRSRAEDKESQRQRRGWAEQRRGHRGNYQEPVIRIATTRICHHRKTLLVAEYGLRTPNIACLNPDSMKEEKMQRCIIKSLARNKMHIAAGQETHITQDRNYAMSNYRIITAEAIKSAAEGGVQGGVAATIHGIIQQNITQLARKSSRSLRVALGRRKHEMPIRIRTTYAPRSGEKDRRRHWGDAKEILNKPGKRHMIIW